MHNTLLDIKLRVLLSCAICENKKKQSHSINPLFEASHRRTRQYITATSYTTSPQMRNLWLSICLRIMLCQHHYDLVFSLSRCQLEWGPSFFVLGVCICAV